MTTQAVTSQAIQPPKSARYGVTQVIRSEVAKIVSLRSNALIVGLTTVIALLVTGLVAHAALHHAPPYYNGFDPTQESLTGLIFAGLTGGVFGALLITGEYSSGTIRTTLAATPRRRLLLVGKLVVAAVATVAFCELLSLATFFLGQGILSGGGAPSASLGTPGALRAVTFTGLFIALLSLMAFGFGLIVRSTAGALAAFVAVVFVLPLVMRGISQPDLRYVPTNMLVDSIMSTVNQFGPGPMHPLSAAIGLLLMTLYAAAALVVGAVLFMRRDA